MIIKDLFEKDIFRGINGVVKADQKDEASVWQELDEFVITQELDKHLRDFFRWYATAWDKIKKPDPSAKMGIWISGFFGSGKSHLLKVLSYLLKNGVHSFEGETQRAVSFFETKIKDPLFFAELNRSVAEETDVVLFNIDAKADHNKGKDLILRLFLKVLNEVQGFSGDYPHIAHMERNLKAKGKYELFKEAYKKHAGKDWDKEKDAYEFSRDEVVKAFMEALNQSQTAAEKWIDGAEENLAITIENLCKWTKEYLDSKGPRHRLVFLIDEVGQFIGNESKLMLNLQSIVEGLGVICAGRAWVVVTSQENMDSLLNDMNKTKKDDFSKIQGRFEKPLSLSSANVDEVIQSRLLSKVPGVVSELKSVFKQKGDILKNQISFKNCKMTLRHFRDDDDFSKNYPFVPYQFHLVQKVFEAIRKAGATGTHLAKGERSMLDAFQSAAKIAAQKEVGVLVPFYDFYPSIQGFLDTVVKRTIDQASAVVTLQPFDIKLLQVLFLIRYVDEVKGNVDNLVTLCLDQIDCNRLLLRRSIEESLGRLENESLINRNGDLYTFLTNEERDIDREIKQIELQNGEDSQILGDLIYADIYKDLKKYRYSANKMDFDFNRKIDSFVVGTQKEGYLSLAIFSPLGDEYETLDKGRCVLKSGDNNGEIWIRLGSDETLEKEVRTYLQTHKFVRRKNDGTLPDSVKMIIARIATENQNRYERLSNIVQQMLGSADYCVAGQSLTIKTGDPRDALASAFEYLIENTFPKMGYLKRLLPDPLKELQATLRSNDVSKETLLLQAGENNPDALNDIRSQLDLYGLKNIPVVLYDLLEKKALRPYGWVEGEVLVLIGRLLVFGEIQLIMDSHPIPLDKAYESLTNTNKRKKITLKKRIIVDPVLIQWARHLGKDLFKETGPDGADAISSFLIRNLAQWQANLNTYKILAETGKYPGHQEITDGLNFINNLIKTETDKFLERSKLVEKDLLSLRDNYENLFGFYTSGKTAWDKLRQAFDTFKLNRTELEKDPSVNEALLRMQQILLAQSPYSILKEADQLITKVELLNNSLIASAREEALKELDSKLTSLDADLAKLGADAKFNSVVKQPLLNLKESIAKQPSLPHIAQAKGECTTLYDAAVKKVEAWVSPDEIVVPPPIKKQKVIKPLDYSQNSYIETQDQVDAFLKALRTDMEQALKNNERIQIR